MGLSGRRRKAVCGNERLCKCWLDKNHATRKPAGSDQRQCKDTASIWVIDWRRE